MQISSSFALKNSTHNRVSLLLDRDFDTFQRTKTQNSFSRFYSSIWRFFARLFQKKPIFYFLLFCGAFFAVSVEAAMAAETKTFIATAYYSPMPDQAKYYTGTYAGDLALNGGNSKASDGTPVYVGMVAAPKSYTFGTKINLDGIGVVSVHDRGGAIGAGDGYDRIDIWMGYGDAGLARTLAWGRREITGTIVDSGTSVSLDLENILNNAPKAGDLALKKLQTIGYNTSGRTFSDVILQFQLDYGVINSRTDAGAGNYGPKTTAKLSEVYNNFLKNGSIQTPKVESSDEKNLPSTQESLNANNSSDAEKLSENMSTNFFGVTDEKVQNLQNFLRQSGYSTDNNSGKMDLSTLHALRKYQSAKNIGQTGRVDLRTQITIASDLSK
jgi:putative peptidoglycan binding domain